MCGIAGIFGLEKLDDPRAVVRRMTDACAHRGPDATGEWVGDQAVFGHRRLSIIDRTSASDQPFRSSDGNFTLIFNGELYNYRELRRELEQTKAQSFRTHSDTEVLLAAYMHWGRKCLDRFHGMFAFAIHNAGRGEVFIARDRLGIKPLYYHHGDRHFLFASEIRSILASGLVPRKLDQVSLIDHLRYQTVHAPGTIVKDVQMLLPGHYMIVSDEDIVIEKWWDLNGSADRSASGLDRPVVEREIRSRLTKAVERRLVADVPFGAFLSGGIDSSAIVGLMSEVSDSRIYTFSVVFDEEEFSEEHYASIVAKKFNTLHETLRLKAGDMLKALPSILGSMDHPSGDGANTWMVSKATKEAGISMALSGLGGDELFAGYPVFRHVMSLWERRYITQFPEWSRKAARALLPRLRPEFARSAWADALLLDSFTVDRTYPLGRLLATDRELRSLLKDGSFPPNKVRSIMHRMIREGNGHDLPFLGQVSLGELSTYLPNVLLRDTDQMSMAHALEVRVPFLDHELVQFVLGVSDVQKFPHSPKQLLVSSLGDLLPKEVVHRKKMGFVLPWEEWMKKDLRQFCAERMHSLGKRAIFRSGALDRMWEAFLKGDPGSKWFRIWSLVVLEDWFLRNRIEE
ncbi:MAG: asparagine synthase (glutamine-hydrolyzing) [Bacteroidota bacterium]|nr:asparagine synthase (glutamine-hydrolyzing) [Bacteroidota bacterium]